MFGVCMRARMCVHVFKRVRLVDVLVFMSFCRGYVCACAPGRMCVYFVTVLFAQTINSSDERFSVRHGERLIVVIETEAI